MYYERLDTFLKSLNMTKSNSDYNLYYIDLGNNKTIFIIYVDDFFLIGGDNNKIS
uniref:Reverse transcriptase Ty1/copia-type domain-containing protein n=1 Tax=Physcomitrium patens TaxID=3218 RepID=A0A2K1K3Z2_PHYPA|nr:hypothetical protein PHYPA_012965 [Physcomitrium patens]